MQEILLIAVLVFILWLWRDSLQSREKAINTAQLACQQINAQLLDQTVVLKRLRLCRTKRGSMALCREYNFDFSMDGQNRRQGSVAMQSLQIIEVVLDIDTVSNLQ